MTCTYTYILPVYYNNYCCLIPVLFVVSQQMKLVIQKCNLNPSEDGLSVVSLLLGNQKRRAIVDTQGKSHILY